MSRARPSLRLLAGALVRQPRRQPTLGTLPTDTPPFAVVIFGTALVVGALSFFPALGPIVEQLMLTALRPRTIEETLRNRSIPIETPLSVPGAY